MAETGINWEYLGDGVYLGDDGYQLWLAANSHENPVLALDDATFNSLVVRGQDRFRIMSGLPPRQ